MFGLHDLKGLFQPELFCDSIILVCPLYVAEGQHTVSPELSLLQDEKKKLSRTVFIRDVLKPFPFIVVVALLWTCSNRSMSLC